MATTFNVFYLGTTTDVLDPTEGNFIAEGSGLLVGETYGSSGDPLAGHIQEWSAVSYSAGQAAHFDMDNLEGTDNTFSIDGGADQTMDAMVIYNATITYTDGTTATVTAVLIQDTDGNLYLMPEFSDLDGDDVKFSAKPIESITLDSVQTDNSLGLFADRLGNDDVIPICFTQGTLISCDRGHGAIKPLKIEDLSPGDQIPTLDNGFQPIRWIGSHKFDAIDLAANPKLKPIRITAGALGSGLPERDLVVSRQHRILVSSKIAERMFGALEILIPAIKLTELPGIYVDEDVSKVEYFHIMFDSHEVIYAEGAPTESLFTGPEALKAVSPQARTEILTIFPELEDREYTFQSARHIPATGKLMKELVARHAKNNKPLLEHR